MYNGEQWTSINIWHTHHDQVDIKHKHMYEKNETIQSSAGDHMLMTGI